MAIGLNKVTPTIVKRFRDAFIFLLAGAIAFTPVLAPAFNILPEHFAMWDGMAILLVNFGAKMFGLEDEAAVAQLQEKIDSIENKKP